MQSCSGLGSLLWERTVLWLYAEQRHTMEQCYHLWDFTPWPKWSNTKSSLAGTKSLSLVMQDGVLLSSCLSGKKHSGNKGRYLMWRMKHTYTFPVSSERGSAHSVAKGKTWCVENWNRTWRHISESSCEGPERQYSKGGICLAHGWLAFDPISYIVPRIHQE